MTTLITAAEETRKNSTLIDEDCKRPVQPIQKSLISIIMSCHAKAHFIALPKKQLQFSKACSDQEQWIPYCMGC